MEAHKNIILFRIRSRYRHISRNTIALKINLKSILTFPNRQLEIVALENDLKPDPVEFSGLSNKISN